MKRLLHLLLIWHKRNLEKQIDFEKWNPELSAQLDATVFLLEG